MPGKIAVLIPAAGKGLRLGGERKQFRLLDGKPLLIRSIEVFQHHSAIHEIIMAVPEQDRAMIQEVLSAEGIAKLEAVVAGGATRQQSVYAALNAVSREVDAVLVHDGVRPFVAHDMIDRVVAATRAHGAAAAAVPVADTLRRVGAGIFKETVPRSGLFRMQTPQGCRRDWFLKAHRYAAQHNIEATDDVDLIQQAGYEVKIVEGSSLNIKITTRADWDLACIMWPAWRG